MRVHTQNRQSVLSTPRVSSPDLFPEIRYFPATTDSLRALFLSVLDFQKLLLAKMELLNIDPSQKPYHISLEVKEKVPLEGEELEAYERKKKEEAQEKERQKRREKLEGVID